MLAKTPVMLLLIVLLFTVVAVQLAPADYLTASPPVEYYPNSASVDLHYASNNQGSGCLYPNTCNLWIVYVPPANTEFLEAMQGGDITKGCNSFLPNPDSQSNPVVPACPVSDPNGACRLGSYSPCQYSPIGHDKNSYCVLDRTQDFPINPPGPGIYYYCGMMYATGLLSPPHGNSCTGNCQLTTTGTASVASLTGLPTGSSVLAPPNIIPGTSANAIMYVSGLYGASGQGEQNNISFALETNLSTGCIPSGQFNRCQIPSCYGIPSFYNPTAATNYECGIAGFGSYAPGQIATAEGYGDLVTQCDSTGTVCTGWSLTDPTLSYSLKPGTYNICAYYHTGQQNCDPANSVLFGSTQMNLGGIEPDYGLNLVGKPPVLASGNTTYAVVTPTAAYSSSDATANPNPANKQPFQDICSTDGGDSNGFQGGKAQPDLCYLEFAGPVGSGCIAPFSNPLVGQPTVLPDCYPTKPGTSNPSTPSNPWEVPKPLNPPCILNEFSNFSTNVQNVSYTQPFSSQYLSNSTPYELCFYDYMFVTNMSDHVSSGMDFGPPTTQTGEALYSPFFATATVLCAQGGDCAITPGGYQFVPTPCPPQSGLNCGNSSITPGLNGTYKGQIIQPFKQAACGIFGTINVIFLLFALILLAAGAALYAGASVLPGQQKGTLQAYSMGFVIIGIISVVIVAVALFALAVATNSSIPTVLSQCT